MTSLLSWVRGVVAVGLLCAVAARAADEAQLRKIDALFGRWDVKDAPGVIVAISEGGKIVHARGYGMANLDHGVPLTPDTITESGSVAKQFTAAAVALLHVRGKLSLDDSVRKHIPELSTVYQPVTVRMLVNHTGGVRDIHGLNDLLGRPSYWSPQNNTVAVRVLAKQTRLNFEPGTEYLYSNGGYVLASEVVARVSGKTFAAFCDEEVFVARGLKNTSWRDDFTRVIPGRATGYSKGQGGKYRIDLPYSNLVGNGGVLTTVGDLLAWTESLANPPTDEWRKVVALLETPSKLKNGHAIVYGLGLQIDDYAGVPEIGHGGATSGYRTYLTRFPTKGLAIAVLSNAGDFDGAGAAHGIARILLGVTQPQVKEVKIGGPVDGFAGMYFNQSADQVMRLTAKEGTLSLGGGALVRTGASTFSNRSGSLKLAFDEPDAQGRMQKFTLTDDNGSATFVAKAPAKPSAADLAAYAGTYRSAELGVSVVFAVDKGKLTSEIWPGPAGAGEPTFADGFHYRSGWHITFVRDASGKVTGAEATNGRVRRVLFDRQ
ncbi:MAG TPA: serine hydrolase [Opitutaceae bacterium]